MFKNNIVHCNSFYLLQVIWGISCGVPDAEAEGANTCETLTTSTQDGYMCTCNSSWCNNIDNGKQMIARAELGITGSGLMCHTCSGTSGLCLNSTDEGSLIDCGEGVSTCLVATGEGLYKLSLLN